jgi:hypothetical protein
MRALSRLADVAGFWTLDRTKITGRIAVILRQHTTPFRPMIVPGICLKGTAGARKYTRAVAELFGHRGAIVHQGRATGDLDLLMPRRAYILCLQRIASLLDSLPRESGSPIGDLLGD